MNLEALLDDTASDLKSTSVLKAANPAILALEDDCPDTLDIVPFHAIQRSDQAIGHAGQAIEPANQEIGHTGQAIEPANQAIEAANQEVDPDRFLKLYPNSFHTADLKHVVDNMLGDCLSCMKLWLCLN